jgi:hypothetical protein
VPGTTGPGNAGAYTPAIGTATGPCAASIPTDITFNLGVFSIPLENVQVGATYVGTPATGLINGLIRGFISEDDAAAIVLPDLVGGGALPSVLPGGTGSCAPHDDRDVSPSLESGWYVYLNFTAHAVTWNP